MRVEQGSHRFGGPRAVGVAAGTVLLAAATLIFVLRPLSIAMPAAGLDASWMAVLGQAATVPARWGVDLAFTYGPASALVTRYFTATYLGTALPVLTGVALVYGYGFVRLVTLSLADRRPALPLKIVAIMVAAADLGSQAGLDQDAFYFAFALTFYLLDLARPPQDRASLTGVLLGAAVIGTMAVAKTSFGIAGLLLFVLADLRSLLVLRRAPLTTAVSLAAALVTYLGYGQRLVDLPSFLRLQGETVAGYGEAMYLVGRRSELLGFLVAAAILLAVSIAAAWRDTRWPETGPNVRRVFAPLGLAWILLIGLKAGFVRQDTHPQIAWSVLGLTGLPVAVALLPRSVGAAAALAGAASAVLWFAAPLFLVIDTDRTPGRVELAATYGDMFDGIGTEAKAWRRFLGDPSSFAAEAQREKAAAWEAIRTQHPLPALVGSVDILPSAQSELLANRLDYHPRPSFQEYLSYTAGLIAANKAFIEGQSAPDWILFGSGGLDERYPTMTEGALWPELLSRYEPVRLIGDWLALHRRVAPLQEILGPAQEIAARLGQPFLPPPGAVFARVVVRKTLLGRLAAGLFRPPALNIEVGNANGTQQSFRFIPALGAAGFLLSPLIEDPNSFALLGIGDAESLDDKAVTGVVIGGSSLAGYFYASDIAVEFRPVTLKDVTPSAEARPFFDELLRQRPWRQLVRRMGQSANFDGERLSAPAPTSLTFDSDGARKLRLGFGIEDGAWITGQTQGVCFAVAAGVEAPQILWQRCLDPHDVVADRGPQTAELVLPPGLSRIAIATACPRSCDWGWSYWKDIEPEK